MKFKCFRCTKEVDHLDDLCPECTRCSDCCKCKYEIKLEDFEAITNEWLFNPDKREAIEHQLAEIGIIAKAVPLGIADKVYLSVTIPGHIIIAAPDHEDDGENSIDEQP